MRIGTAVKWALSLGATGLAVWAVVFVARADLSALADMDLNWPAFVGVIPLYLVITITRGMRIKVMSGSRDSVWQLTGISALHVFITKVFPFRTGELFLPIMLKKYGVVGYAKGSGILLSIRLLDFLILFLALFVSSFFVRRDFFETYWVYLSGGFLLCIVLLLVILIAVVQGRESRLVRSIAWPPRLVALAHRAGALLSGEKPSSQDPQDAHGVSRAAASAGPKRLGVVLIGGLLTSAFSWLLVFFSFLFLLDWAGIEGLSLPAVILGSAGAVIAAFLPINTLLSLGTIEAGWATSLYLVGVDPSLGVIAGFRLHGAIFFFNILFALLGLLVLRLSRRPVTG